MKQRLFYNWNAIRVLYVVIGVSLSIQSFRSSEWMGVIFGLYFSAMGIFALGCAAGNCSINLSNSKNDSTCQQAEISQK
ncbi:MAG TPA: hypothetical protein PLI97_07955 [Fluviicola sp.]|nr:hypothetical protein [Fluviicola sp.]